jgi:hypothetical protein
MPLTKCKAESLDLTANYTFTGDVTLASGGSLNLISTQTASSSASISFTTGIDSTYDEYWFVFNNCHPSTDSAKLVFQGSTDGGSNYNTTMTTTFFNSYHAENDTFNGLAYDGADDQAQTTNYQKISSNIGNDNDTATSGILKLFNPSSTTYVKHYHSRLNIIRDRSQESYSAGYFNTTSPINAIQFQMSSGNIDDGTIQLFGVSQ